MTPRIPDDELFALLTEARERRDPAPFVDLTWLTQLARERAHDSGSGGTQPPVPSLPDQTAGGGAAMQPPSRPASHVTAGPTAECALQAAFGGHPADGADLGPAPSATYALEGVPAWHIALWFALAVLLWTPTIAAIWVVIR